MSRFAEARAPLPPFGHPLSQAKEGKQIHSSPGREKGAVQDAGVAQVVENNGRVFVGQRHNRSDHGLVARREHQRTLETKVLSESLFELNMRRCRRLNA